MQAYGVFYKDREGYDILVDHNGQYLTFLSMEIAQSKAEEYKKFIDDTMSPRIEYVRKSFFNKQMVKISNALPEYLRILYTRQKETLFLKVIKIT